MNTKHPLVIAIYPGMGQAGMYTRQEELGLKIALFQCSPLTNLMNPVVPSMNACGAATPCDLPDAIRQLGDGVDIVFVPAVPSVRAKLREAGIDYVTIVPSPVSSNVNVIREMALNYGDKDTAEDIANNQWVTRVYTDVIANDSFVVELENLNYSLPYCIRVLRNVLEDKTTKDIREKYKPLTRMTRLASGGFDMNHLGCHLPDGGDATWYTTEAWFKREYLPREEQLLHRWSRNLE